MDAIIEKLDGIENQVMGMHSIVMQMRKDRESCYEELVQKSDALMKLYAHMAKKVYGKEYGKK